MIEFEIVYDSFFNLPLIEFINKDNDERPFEISWKLDKQDEYTFNIKYIDKKTLKYIKQYCKALQLEKDMNYKIFNKLGVIYSHLTEEEVIKFRNALEKAIFMLR